MKRKNLTLKKFICVLGLFLCLAGLISCGHKHSFGAWEETEPPTCLDEGARVALCRCGEKKIESVEAMGHSGLRTETERAATCASGGLEVTRCGVCHAVISQKETSPIGHELLEAEKREATCEDVGWESYFYCSRCDYSERREIAPTGHTASGAVADCKTAISCLRCGRILEDAKGHREKIVYGREATCDRAGISDGKQCYDCGEVIEAQISIPRSAHKAKTIEGTPATCAVSGISEGIRCADCGEILAEAAVIPLRAHEYAEDGVCVVCLKRASAPFCIHENQTVSPKINSSCNKYGLTQGVSCDDCGEILVEQEVIEPKAHTEKVVEKALADCVGAGLSEGSKCSVCRQIIKAQELIPPMGHQVVSTEQKSPDCASNGQSAGRSCKICGEIIVVSNQILPAGHRTISVEGREATCTEGGWLPYFWCADCGFTDYCEIAPLGHSEEKLAQVSATCTDTGLSEGLACRVCGEVTLPRQVVPKLGHSFTLLGEIEGGCASMSSVAVCRYCFSIKQDGAQGGHSLKLALVSPTCTQGGSLAVSCQLCARGCTISVDALGHDLVWSVTDSGHSQKCCRERCNYKGAESGHGTQVKAVCEDVFCDDCGFKMGDGQGHRLSSIYKSDETHHWNRCLNAYCGYEGNKQEHSSETANCDDSRAKCSVCSAYYDPKKSHLLGDWFVSPQGDLRRTCANCTYYETRAGDRGAPVGIEPSAFTWGI